jgi:beta-galactosidase
LWKWITLRDYFSGNFMWTGFDYLGESTWPFKGFPSGALDITGEPKDAFYLYQSLWTDTPVLRLFPHWNWPGREGRVIPVLAYSSCNVVELFLNGRSFGEQRKEFPAQGTSGGWNTYALPQIHPTTGDLHFRWDVPYTPGTLTAQCRDRTGESLFTAEVKTAGSAAAVTARAERDSITTARGDVAIVRIAIVDSSGSVVVPTADNQFCVTVTGGEVLALDNGNLQDLSPYRRDCRQTFNGRGIAIIRAVNPGPVSVVVTSSGLRGTEVSLTVREGNSPFAIPGEARR